MDTIYYFQLDTEMNEVGEGVPITIAEDGSADVSALPDGVRRHLIAFGVPDALHRGRIFPKDGEAFMEGLLGLNGPYWRFRESSEPLG